jgi:hypothetical protein
MSQTRIKTQSAYPDDYTRVNNGSIVLNRGKATLPTNYNKSIILPTINRTEIVATKPVSVPSGSGVYLM